MINDGLIDAFNNYHMGVTAENVAVKFEISRDEQDSFALNSQKKAQDATEKKKFKDEIIKLQINNNKENTDLEARETRSRQIRSVSSIDTSSLRTFIKHTVCILFVYSIRCLYYLYMFSLHILNHSVTFERKLLILSLYW